MKPRPQVTPSKPTAEKPLVPTTTCRRCGAIEVPIVANMVRNTGTLYSHRVPGGGQLCDEGGAGDYRAEVRAWIAAREAGIPPGL